MRQAGRYHSHYQALKKKYSFIDLCKIPEVACETAMGPIRDFDFDAAILFSDLLFPLEVMGMPLRYDPGPKLDWYLTDKAGLKRLQGGRDLAAGLEFQAEAMKLLRKSLDPKKGLLGFVGGPLTLYCYAVEGGHSGAFASARAGFGDGRFAGFSEKLLDLLAENMALQARGGADTVAILDTCAGEFDPRTYAKEVVPVLKDLLRRYRDLCPEIPAFYYSKGTGPEHWKYLEGLPIAGIGIDWHHDISQVLRDWGKSWAIQGNIDPEWLFLEAPELEKRLRNVFESVKPSLLSLEKGGSAD
jgi:uroporphyrinogen decarboxylase